MCYHPGAGRIWPQCRSPTRSIPQGKAVQTQAKGTDSGKSITLCLCSCSPNENRKEPKCSCKASDRSDSFLPPYLPSNLHHSARVHLPELHQPHAEDAVLMVTHFPASGRGRKAPCASRLKLGGPNSPYFFLWPTQLHC